MFGFKSKKVKRLEEQKNTAYYERNMLVLLLAIQQQKNDEADALINKQDYVNHRSGWYYDTEMWDGFTRVISLYNGTLGYHIPDDFDIGNLKEIEPSWDGHTTSMKYDRLAEMCGAKRQF